MTEQERQRVAGRAMSNQEVSPVKDDELYELRKLFDGWRFEEQDALARWLAGACDRAGITDRRQRLALQEELHKLLE